MLQPTNEQSMHAEWSHVSERVARLLVRESAGLAQTRSGDVRSLSVGGVEVVRASSESCDDGWVLEVGAPATPGAHVPASILGHFEEFAAGSRAAGRGEALGLLPAGEYLVVRSSRAPAPTRFVVLGNERFEAAAHEQALFDAPPAPHVVVIGDRRGEPPRLDRLLIGIALSGFGGLASDGTVALVALASAGGTRGAGPEASTGDLVMVVPIDGDLVITHFKQTEVEWPKVVSGLAQRLAALPQLPRLDFGVDSDQVARLRVERDPYELPAVRAIRGGPTAELCVHGRVAVKLTTTRGPAAEWTVARDLTVRLEDAEPEWDFAGPYLAWEGGGFDRLRRARCLRGVAGRRVRGRARRGVPPTSGHARRWRDAHRDRGRASRTAARRSRGARTRRRRAPGPAAARPGPRSGRAGQRRDRGRPSLRRARRRRGVARPAPAERVASPRAAGLPVSWDYLDGPYLTLLRVTSSRRS